MSQEPKLQLSWEGLHVEIGIGETLPHLNSP